MLVEAEGLRRHQGKLWDGHSRFLTTLPYLLTTMVGLTYPLVGAE